AATASIGYPEDFLAKVQKAKDTDGPSYLQVYCPCPTGWGYPPEITVDLAKEAVDTGLWFLGEFEEGIFWLNRKPRAFASLREHLARQGRFRHLQEEDLAALERERDHIWESKFNLWPLAK
ncbi:MAG TPA: hypothetical protein PK364_09140, partial [Synergistaceae bacterium]|nr:hypothetical protein [Synergistaceae bacterium]